MGFCPFFSPVGRPLPTVFKTKELVISEEEIKPDERDYASMSLMAALAAWFVFVILTIFTNVMLGSTASDRPWGAEIFAIIAMLSYPISGFAVVCAVIALFKRQSVVKLILGGLLGGKLFLFISRGVLVFVF